ncbi:PspA/IM30 family protein [Corynebacterium lubricantis]|uniref:PspA/IM30 family protein n=1 Tax=Corynebacterium lubricantis TaxID=541095 RepID=UPI00035C0E18|nr:PspA/IM30 family protein [Corynebacterium lubricantis]
MANPFSKGWKYLMASFDQKIDENADPKVQIQQAVAAAKKQHQQITEQAASIIGNKKQLEMQMNRLQKSQEDYQQKARTALMAADKAAGEGDSEKAQQFSNTAEIFASQLVAVEQELENTKNMYQQADQAAAQAQKQQQESETRLKGQLAEVDKLMAQADQAAMQEKTTEAMDTIGQFNTDDSVPTLDGVRDKIERRYADALGQQELLGNTVNDRMSEISSAGTDMKASAKLDEIRASMRSPEQLTAGSGAAESDAADSSQASEHDSDIDEAEAYLAEDTSGDASHDSEGETEQK